MVFIKVEFQTKCRACLASEEKMHDLFAIFSFTNETLSDILEQTTSIKVSRDDGLSCYLCNNCAKIVGDFHSFKSTFEKTDQYIRSLTQNNPIIGKEIQNSNTDNSTAQEIKIECVDIADEDDNKSCDSSDNNMFAEVDTWDEELTRYNSDTDTEKTAKTQPRSSEKHDAHETRKKPETKFTCKHCTNSYARFESLKDHITSIHKRKPIDRRESYMTKIGQEFACLKCNTKHDSLDALAQHTKTHKDGKRKTCDSSANREKDSLSRATDVHHHGTGKHRSRTAQSTSRSSRSTRKVKSPPPKRSRTDLPSKSKVTRSTPPLPKSSHSAEPKDYYAITPLISKGYVPILADLCWHCGHRGHIRTECKNLPLLFCSRCGKIGTMSKNCTCSSNRKRL